MRQEIPMRLHLRWAEIPELDGLPRDEQRRAWRYAYSRTQFHPLMLAVLILGCFALAVIRSQAAGALGPWSHLVTLIPGLILAFAYGLLLVHRARPHLRAFIEREQASQRGREEPAA
jgi:Ca2+/H+ antiporter